jgi:hypothetical protein
MGNKNIDKDDVKTSATYAGNTISNHVRNNMEASLSDAKGIIKNAPSIAAQFVRIAIVVLVATIIITLVGINFIIITTDELDLINTLYPINPSHVAYEAFPFKKLTRNKTVLDIIVDSIDTIFSKMISMYPLLYYLFPRLPDYSGWVSGTFCLSYITTRMILQLFMSFLRPVKKRSIIESIRNKFSETTMSSSANTTLPHIIVFIFGCLEFAFLAVFLLPISFVCNFFYAPLIENWAAFALGGFIPAFFLAIFNSLYIYITYIFNSTIGIFISRADEFKQIITNLRVDIIVIICWIFIFVSLSHDRNTITPFFASIIVSGAFIITCYAYVTKIWNWFVSLKVSNETTNLKSWLVRN